ncbi:MAG: peptidoglycan-binding domain-containing protein [Clostridia bacterium]|nr:peptidoglycan-binding domain-containing protein [Clostridia bacterium]
MKYNQYDHRQNVLELQTMLRANHLLEGGILINPDGIFDHNTTEAVKLFQRQNGMEITGIVDYATWVLLAENAAQLCSEVPCTVILTP